MSALDDAALAMVQEAFTAARSGQTEVLRGLLERGVPTDVCNEKGDSLLMLGSYHGHADVVRLLLERGADPELSNARGQTPLQGVAFKGELAMATLLLEGGAQVDGGGGDGKTPLMFAAMFDRVAMMGLLLAHGADPRRLDASGTAVSAIARGMGALKAVALLEQLGAHAA